MRLGEVLLVAGLILGAGAVTPPSLRSGLHSRAPGRRLRAEGRVIPESQPASCLDQPSLLAPFRLLVCMHALMISI